MHLSVCRSINIDPIIIIIDGSARRCRRRSRSSSDSSSMDPIIFTIDTSSRCSSTVV